MLKAKKKNNMVKRTWALLRVSSKGQGLVQHGSLEQQRNFAERQLKEISQRSDCQYHITRIIEEEKSGKKSNFHLRKEFHDVLYAIKGKLIDCFVVEKVDRMGRWAHKNSELVEAAQENDVEIIFLEDGKKFDYRNRGEKLTFSIKNVLAEDYSYELEEKIQKKQREAMVNNGKDTSTAPILGLNEHPDKVGFYVINSEEQEIVIDIFNKFVELGELFATAAYCDKKGYRTKERWTKETTDKNGHRISRRKLGGEKFDSKTLRSLLTSSKIRGFNYFEDSWNQFPSIQDESKMIRWEYGHFRESGPVVPHELFEAVQSILEKNKHKAAKPENGGAVYLLTGILQGADGSTLVGCSAKNGEYRYYEDRKKGKCVTVRISKEEIETTICKRLQQYLKESGLLERAINKSFNGISTEVAKIDREIEGKQTKKFDLEETERGFSDQLRAAARNGTLERLISIIDNEKVQVEREILEIQESIDELNQKRTIILEEYKEKTLQEKLVAVLNSFSKRCDLQKQKIIQMIIPKIVVHGDNRLEVFINPLFELSLNGKGSRSRTSGGQKFVLDKNGSGGEIRTPDQAVNSRLLYH